MNEHLGEGIKFSALLGYITWYIKGFFTLKMIVARYLTGYILFQVWIIMAKFDSGKGLPCVCGVSCLGWSLGCSDFDFFSHFEV